MISPQDNLAQQFPVSIKGVFLVDGKVLLLKNERDEYELPGGKLELGEQPKKCLQREIKEETNLDVEINSILDSWLYSINANTHVLIVTYGCVLLNSETMNIAISNEHKELKLASPHEIDSLVMPAMYKESIRCWLDFKK